MTVESAEIAGPYTDRPNWLNRAENLRWVEDEFYNLVSNTAFDDLVQIYDEALPNDTDNRLEKLSKIANKHWDFRQGKNRQAINWQSLEVNQAGFSAQELIYSAANKLGMTESSFSSKDEYDGVVTLGTSEYSAKLRVDYSKLQGVKAEWRTFLSSHRSLSQDEQHRTSWFAPGANTEFDLMCGALESVYKKQIYKAGVFTLNKTGYDYESPPQAAVYEQEGREPFFVLGSPAPVGKEQASTIDTYNHLREAAGKRLQGKNLLLVTESLYKPHQHVSALIHLSLLTGCKVETVGFSSNYSGFNLWPSQILQETKAYIDGLKNLQFALLNS